MKIFFFLLLFSSGAATAAAQHTDAELKLMFDKNKMLLQKVAVHTQKLQPLPVTQTSTNVHELRQDNMPCIIPRINVLVAIPNALPQLNIPDVAAIPNPAFHKDFQKGAVISGPDPE